VAMCARSMTLTHARIEINTRTSSTSIELRHAQPKIYTVPAMMKDIFHDARRDAHVGGWQKINGRMSAWRCHMWNMLSHP
jgi:hypothetical protein